MAAHDARLYTWRTTAAVEVDCVVETSNGLVAIEVKSGHTLRPADRRGLLAFHDEFPEARLIALADVALRQWHGPITIFPLADFLLGIVPGAPLPAWRASLTSHERPRMTNRTTSRPMDRVFS